MLKDIKKLRNIGISAHIDSGKTTLTERILYFTNKIRAMHEVRGKDGIGATMDFMELERERGISISSATTRVSWKDFDINIIDTPGHIDFTIEVENSLRVLDGVILVLCSVGGVQTQTFTVNSQMKRYNIPFIAFINKLDRVGANPFHVKEQMIEKLGHNAVLAQLPIGLEDNFIGIVDLIEMKGVYFTGVQGSDMQSTAIPEDMLDDAIKYRDELIDKVSMFSEELMEKYYEGQITNLLLKKALRQSVLSGSVTPIFLGSAYKNIGVQSLLDAATDYLPSPADKINFAIDLDNPESKVTLCSDSNKETVAMAFKIDYQTYGQLTYLRIYQGKIKKGMTLYNVNVNKKFKVGRIIRMHANSMDDIELGLAGDIVALFGVDCSLGDTFVSGEINYTLKSLHVPQPIVSLALTTQTKESQIKMDKVLQKFQKEDATFKVFTDNETNEIIINGMGELHLEIYIERMRREYSLDFKVGMPEVSYRETIIKEATFDFTQRKQSGGRGQYARICGKIEPSYSENNIFIEEIKGGVIPSNFIPAIEKGFISALTKGKLIGAPIIGVKMTINDGNFHPVDSSDLAFEQAAFKGFNEIYANAQPRILEPVMKLDVQMPSEYRSVVMTSINQRRGLILETIYNQEISQIIATIPLKEIFGYVTVLRSLTQGKIEFCMEFLKYDFIPLNVGEALVFN